MTRIPRILLLPALILISTFSLAAAPLAEIPDQPFEPAPLEDFPDNPENPQRRPEDIQSMKIAFFTEHLKLSPEESAKFWPIYNQYWEERRKIGHTRRDLYKTIRDNKAGDAQVKELLSVMDAERKATATYIEKFKQVIPVDKAIKVFVVDEDFKNFLLRRAASANNGGENQPRR